ncbi:hypothetical protein K435DRAFT_924701 [Dendrothele bispora CBS 962.96]|uniref:Uncharacterized protein n=1 Tax=Dendrothele bispora (strain CBS 962.96) TaxID=1314807 RepID=A0A4V4HD40_DENBC|nr:hypothetical protein K435DRAFT_924701 [Dendrothele bispora CBS 962.96]
MSQMMSKRYELYGGEKSKDDVSDEQFQFEFMHMPIGLSFNTQCHGSRSIPANRSGCGFSQDPPLWVDRPDPSSDKNWAQNPKMPGTSSDKNVTAEGGSLGQGSDKNFGFQMSGPKFGQKIDPRERFWFGQNFPKRKIFASGLPTHIMGGPLFARAGTRSPKTHERFYDEFMISCSNTVRVHVLTCDVYVSSDPSLRTVFFRYDSDNLKI